MFRVTALSGSVVEVTPAAGVSYATVVTLPRLSISRIARPEVSNTWVTGLFPAGMVLETIRLVFDPTKV
jgi:hypothetical protein